jgi:dCTP deaminase
MIIPDHEIRKLLDEGKVKIEPLQDPDKKIKSGCVDLSLAPEFKVFKHTRESVIDSKNPKDYTEDVKVGGKPFVLHPGEFVLGITVEKISLPSDIMGYVDGRSSLGRLGVTAHITSGFVDPGFSGRLVLEMTNLGKMPVMLYSGMGICKLLLFKMSSASEVPYNMRNDAKYHNQDAISQSKIYKDMQ